MWEKTLPFVVKSLQAAIAMVLLYSGLIHASKPFQFLQSVAAYELIPLSLLWVVPFLLPYLMLVLGMCLFLNVFSETSRYLALGLFIVFASAQAAAIASGKSIACGCFGYSTDAVSVRTLAVPLVCSIVLAGCIYASASAGNARSEPA